MKQQFFWGSSTASHQVEGGTKNDWSVWEKKNAERLAREAKTKWAPWQQEKFPEMFSPENYISGAACDQYRRFEEDFDLVKAGGQNAYRFSIEWSRVEPEEGKFDEEELQHYVEVVEALRVRGLEPFVTLWHWTLPLWLTEKGGILAKGFPEMFVRYAERVLEALGDRVKFYMTVNEPNSVIANGYVTGLWPPQKKNIFSALRARNRLAQAHIQTYRMGKEKRPEVQVGFTEFFTVFVARRKGSFLDRFLVRLLWKIFNERFLSHVKGAYDFLGVQNYVSVTAGLLGRQKKSTETEMRSDLGWELSYEGLGEALRSCVRYAVPLYVTEDGLADAEDAKRGMYLEGRVASMEKAMREGVDVRGYFHWSLLDNFEWDKGFWPRFGLVEVDRETLARKPRKSFYRYKELIEKHEKEYV